MRAMKDSGIEWIGRIPENWATPPLRSKYSFGKGLAITKADLADDGAPVISYGQIHAKDNIGVAVRDTLIRYLPLDHSSLTESSKTESGDLIFADTSEDVQGCGNCVYIDRKESIYAGYHTLILRPKVKGLGRYYAYLFASDAWRSQVRANVAGVKVYSITQDILKKTILLEPPSEEQEGIVAFLDAKCSEIDSLIAAKEKTNALLKERRQSLIYEAVTKGLDATVPMKDSGIEWIGTIPENWKTCRIKHLVDTSHPYPVGDGDHGMIKADDYQTEGIPYIRVLNLSWGTGLNLDDLVYISEELNDRIKNSELRPNDILIAKTGATIGKTAIVPDSLTLSNTTSHVGKITISPAYNAKYFFYVMTSFVVQKQIIDLSSMQSTRPELGIDGLKNLIVTLPPMDDQQSISNYLDSQCAVIDSMIGSTDDMIRTLKEYRQSLIYEAVTGKIEV